MITDQAPPGEKMRSDIVMVVRFYEIIQSKRQRKFYAAVLCPGGWYQPISSMISSGFLSRTHGFLRIVFRYLYDVAK